MTVTKNPDLLIDYILVKDTDIKPDYELGREKAREDWDEIVSSVLFEKGYEDEINSRRFAEYVRRIPAHGDEPACSIHYLVQISISKTFDENY